MHQRHKSVLAFSDGALFYGIGVGADGWAVGEAVFNTAMSGYQEILTDPSYRRQIVNFTYPHIGNTGINFLDDESPRVFAAGMIARKITRQSSNWRSSQSLPEFLKAQRTVAIEGVDTRAITRKIRAGGALAACIVTAADGDTAAAAKKAIAEARKFDDQGGLKGAMLAADAGAATREEWREGLWNAADAYPQTGGGRWRVVVLDCGVKRAILRQLAARDCRIVVLPYGSELSALVAQKPDGVVFSNGPGDPAPCDNAAHLAREMLARKTPILGICLGHQIVAAALGAKTLKMKFGHHGANHPVRDEKSGRVLITSQNHGFAVDDRLPPGIRATHTSLFDGTLQGIASDDPPALTFQGHPEASPGPHDADFLFDDFLRMVKNHANA